MSYLVVLICCFLFELGLAEEEIHRHFTVDVGPGDESCFYERIGADLSLDLYYQVVDGTGELQINFRFTSPSSVAIVNEYEMPEGTHNLATLEEGDYSLCLDNGGDAYNAKKVYFELLAYNRSAIQAVGHQDDVDQIFAEQQQQQNKEEMEGAVASEFGSKDQYGQQVESLKILLQSMREKLGRSRQLQDQQRAHETRDRSVLENNFERVTFWSASHAAVLVFAGFAQVMLVRGLFKT